MFDFEGREKHIGSTPHLPHIKFYCTPHSYDFVIPHTNRLDIEHTSNYGDMCGNTINRDIIHFNDRDMIKFAKWILENVDDK